MTHTRVMAQGKRRSPLRTRVLHTDAAGGRARHKPLHSRAVQRPQDVVSPPSGSESRRVLVEDTVSFQRKKITRANISLESEVVPGKTVTTMWGNATPTGAGEGPGLLLGYGHSPRSADYQGESGGKKWQCL